MSRAGEQVVHRMGRGLQLALYLALIGPTLNFSLLPPALPMIATYLGGGVNGEIIAQRAQALPFLGLAMGGLAAGAILSRFGLRACICLAALVYTVAGLAAGAAGSAAALMTSCFVVGLASSLLASGLTTLTGALFDDSGRARMLGFQSAVSDLSAVGMSIVSALLAGHWGWRAPFALYVVYGVLILSLIGFARVPVAPPSEREENGLLRAAKMAGSTLLAGTVLFVVFGSQTTLLPFHLQAHGLVTPESRATVLVAAPAAGITASILYGVIGGRIADHWIIVAAAFLSTFGYVGTALWTGGLPLIVTSALAIGGGMGFAFPMVMRSAFCRTPRALHGYAIGLVNTSVFTGAFLSPLLLGPIFRIQGAQRLFLLAAVAWLIVGMATAFRVRATDGGLSPSAATS